MDTETTAETENLKEKSTETPSDKSEDVEAELEEGKPQKSADGTTSVRISHMQPQELMEISLNELRSMYVTNAYTPEELKQNQKVLDRFKKYYGENFDVEKTELDLLDPKLMQVTKEYVDEKLESIKNKALSMNIAELNDSVNEIFHFIGFNDIDLSTTPKKTTDKMFHHRVGHFPEMANTYMVLDTVRDILDISTDSTMSLGSTNRLEHDIKVMTSLHHKKAINSEQMAIIYENVARIHEHYFAKDKNNKEAIDSEKKIAGKYMEEALNLTSDVWRIQSCTEYLQGADKKLTPKIARMVQTAYERYFNRIKKQDERVLEEESPQELSSAHEKYADVIIGQEAYVGFISETAKQKIHHNTDKALSHYIQAIKTSSLMEDKVQILNKMVHYLQKFNYGEKDEYFWKSVNVVNDAFSGDNKIMNLMNLLPRIKQNKMFKKFLLEASINELLDTRDMDTSRRNLLLKNTGQQWLKLADKKKDAVGIAVVTDTLKKIETEEKARKQKEQMPISRTSSRGKDYFS